MLGLWPFFRMLLVVDDCAYAYDGCWAVEEWPRWFRRVLRAVGLLGEGESGVRGREEGGLRESDAGLEAALMLRESFGLAARVASIVG